MKRLILLGITLMPAAGYGQSATPAQEKAALVPLLTCYIEQAEKLDDLQSPAADIAQALEGSCPKQWAAWADVHSMGFTPEQSAEIRSDMLNTPSDEYTFALRAVLAERKAGIAKQ